MTYPVDDAGNPRVDFVWGNMPLQPNDQRNTYNTGNKFMDAGWMVSPTVGSANLATGWDVIYPYRGDGDNEEVINPVGQIITYDSHEIAVENYEGYPSFIQGYPYDDLVPNITMPNLIGLTTSQAATALNNLGYDGSITTNNNVTAGATSGNNGKVASQAPASGVVINNDAAVILNTYNYVVSGGPISGFNNTVTTEGWTLESGDTIMYVVGRTVKPTIDVPIHISGSSNATYNHGFNVIDVVDNDTYNTGGTAVWLRPFEMVLDAPTSSGGTWTPYY